MYVYIRPLRTISVSAVIEGLSNDDNEEASIADSNTILNTVGYEEDEHYPSSRGSIKSVRSASNGFSERSRENVSENKEARDEELSPYHLRGTTSTRTTRTSSSTSTLTVGAIIVANRRGGEGRGSVSLTSFREGFYAIFKGSMQDPKKHIVNLSIAYMGIAATSSIFQIMMRHEFDHDGYLGLFTVIQLIGNLLYFAVIPMAYYISFSVTWASEKMIDLGPSTMHIPEELQNIKRKLIIAYIMFSLASLVTVASLFDQNDLDLQKRVRLYL